jgi:hypothetical protein
VINVKYQVNGRMEKFKTRLVTRGFTQIYKIDFDETFAPTMRINSLRILLYFITLKDMKTEQVDVNNAFTESTLEEDIYISPSPGLTLPRRCVLKLNRNFYGLKQSARQWYRKYTKALKKKDFVQCISDPCVFIRGNGAIIGVYVDDLIILMPKRQHNMMRGIKKNLKAEFKIKELGNVQKILDIRMTRDRKRRTVYLDQTQYIRRFLHEFHMTELISKPVRIPVNGNSAFRKTRVTN